MKTKIVLSACLLVFIHFAKAQNQRGMISVNDMRKAGLTKHEHDTSVSDHVAGDLIVNRTLSLKPEYMREKGQKDTLDSYEVHFFKMYEGKLTNYSFSYSNEASYDKAAFHWLNDTVVSVMLINSATKENAKLKLVQAGNTAGLTMDGLK